MSETRIVSEAEVEQALTEARAQAAEIPSLDERAEPPVVPIPVEVPQFRPLRPSPDSPAAPEPGTTGPGTPPTPAEVKPSWVRRLFRLKRPKPVTAAEPAATGSAGRGILGGWAGRLYMLVDTVLELINRPFAWVPPAGRSALGFAGLVTLLMSLAAPWVMPLVCPPRDAVSWLRERREATEARLAAARAEAAAAAAKEPEGHTAAPKSEHAAPAKPAGGGH